MNVQTGSSHYVRLADGDDGASRRESSDALRAWSRRGFHQQHLLDLFAQAETDLYVGDVRGAYDRVARTWPEVNRSQLLLIQSNHVILHDLFARTEIGAARLSRGARRRALVASAERRARRLEGHAMGWSSAMARLLRAAVAALGYDPARAGLEYDTAANALDAHGMKLHAAAARLRAASLDPRMRAEVHRARRRFEDEGVRDVDRFAAMLAP
jgi:hypothetical protein